MKNDKDLINFLVQLYLTGHIIHGVESYKETFGGRKHDIIEVFFTDITDHKDEKIFIIKSATVCVKDINNFNLKLCHEGALTKYKKYLDNPPQHGRILPDFIEYKEIERMKLL